jgi:hypothetical protein
MHYILINHDEDEYNPSVITVLGLFSMTLSLIGNLKQMEEMYPLFIEKNRNTNKKNSILEYIEEVPVSLFISCLSDVTLLIYGAYINDVIIVIYGSLNSALVILVVISVQFSINDANSTVFLDTCARNNETVDRHDSLPKKTALFDQRD